MSYGRWTHLMLDSYDDLTDDLIDFIPSPSASLSEESESDKINVSMSDRIDSVRNLGRLGRYVRALRQAPSPNSSSLHS